MIIDGLPELTHNKQQELGHAVLVDFYRCHVNMDGVKVSFEVGDKP